MAYSKLLVSLQTIKDNSYIEGNVEPAKLRQAALEAQRIQVHSVLGTRLTDLYLDALSDDGTLTGLTTIQETFYNDHLIPFYAACTEAQFVLAANFQLSNIGVAKNKSTNNDTSTLDEVKYIRKESMNRADHYAQRAKNFILDPANYEDLGRYYYAGNQNLPPQGKVNQSFIYTPYRNGSGGSCPYPSQQ